MPNFKELIKITNSQSFNVHDKYKHLTIPELKEINNRDTLPFAVCCLNITGDLNVSNIIRTSCIFGAKKVIVIGRTKFDNRGLVGADKYIDVETHSILNYEKLDIEVDSFNNIIKDYFKIFCETDGVNFADFNFTYPAEQNFQEYLLIFGNEGIGIPKNLRHSGFTVSIPQRGVLRSLNVSTAAGILIQHVSSSLIKNRYV